jgi:phytoene dehydrogenase-like protein
VTARFYDVVVLGTRLGSLACAALLARRDFRVLVLGHGARPSTYRWDGVPLRRRAFAHLAAPSPAFRRVIAELAQSQAFRRRLRPLDPMLQVLDPKRRIDLPPDPELFARELEREFPVARASIEELYSQLAQLNARIDEVFERDAVWPPGTFWERRETNKLRDLLPALGDAARGRASRHPVAELTIDAGYRSIVEITARFASDVAMGNGYSVPLLPVARLHGAWSRGVHELPGDEDELVASLVERIRAHGGDVRPAERCEAILHRRGRVTGVVLEGDGEATSCTFVIGDRPAARLVDLVRDLELEGEQVPTATIARRRFVLSLVVKNELVPAPLARHAFLVPLRDDGIEVHLHRATFTQSALGDHTDPALEALGAELWVCEALLDEALLPVGGGGRDTRAREAVLATVRDHFPYVDRHALLIDSTHDGAPLIDLRSGERKAIERALLRGSGGQVEPEIADPQYQRDPDGYAGLAGESLRTPVDNLLSVSPAVLPALGAEGELVAAWGAARLVTRTDRRREKMRREMWSKIEI